MISYYLRALRLLFNHRKPYYKIILLNLVPQLAYVIFNSLVNQEDSGLITLRAIVYLSLLVTQAVIFLISIPLVIIYARKSISVIKRSSKRLSFKRLILSSVVVSLIYLSLSWTVITLLLFMFATHALIIEGVGIKSSLKRSCSLFVKKPLMVLKFTLMTVFMFIIFDVFKIIYYYDLLFTDFWQYLYYVLRIEYLFKDWLGLLSNFYKLILIPLYFIASTLFYSDLSK